MEPDRLHARAQELEYRLLKDFGPLLSGKPLRKLLGHPTPDAFRQALRRQPAPVPLFKHAGRKGWCAFTRDVALWIVGTQDRNPQLIEITDKEEPT